MAVKLRSVGRGYWNRFVQVGMASLALEATALLLEPARPARVQAGEIYNETLVPTLTAQKPDGVIPVAAVEETTTPALPYAMQPIGQTMDVPSAPCNGGMCNFEDTSPLYVSAFGGASYFNNAANTPFGGIYGTHLAADLTDRLGVMATGLINNYNGATQYAGTVGGYLNTNYYGDKSERFGGAVSFDQFTDTGLGSPYLAQARFRVDYRILPSVIAAVQYTDPLIGSSTAVVPGAGTTPFRSPHVTQGFLTVGGTTVGVGYVEEEHSMTYSFMNTRPLTDRLSSIVNASYDPNVHLWIGFVGMQLQLSRPGTERWMASRSNFRGESRDVVRGGSLVGSSGGSSDSSFNQSDVNEKIRYEQIDLKAIQEGISRSFY